MKYTVGNYFVHVEKDVVYIGLGDERSMFHKPNGFDERLQDIFARPADSRGTTKEIFMELFGVTKPEPKALDIDTDVYDG